MDHEDDSQHQNDPLEEQVEEIEKDGDDDAILSESSNEEVEIENAFVRALGYDLVTDKLVSFLTIEDIKALSAVSLNCYVAVRKTKNFANRACLIICKDSMQVLQEDSFKWRHVSIDLLIPALDADQIAYMLPTVKTISLWLSKITDNSSTEINSHLIKILSRTTSLKTLELDTSIFKNNLLNVLCNAAVQETLGDLEGLIIESKVAKEVCHINAVEYIDSLPFQRNLRLLAEMPLKLKKFVFGKAVYANIESECRHLKYIPKIVNATKDTLEELELHLNVWKLAEMMESRCSNLKCLRISTHVDETTRRDAEVVEMFLKNQPPLEELDIGMKKELPIRIVQIFPDIASQMKRLHIKAKYIFSDTSVNWTFLETMDKLKDFQIKKATSWLLVFPDRYGSGEEILDKLPDGLEKISLQGFQPFWRRGSDWSPRNIGDILSRFVNLTEIDFWRSGGALNDEGMQILIRNCSKLTSLIFSQCGQLTSFGISGVRKSEDGTAEEKVGVSLKDLKCLIRLKIRGCRYVSPECLLNEIRFDFLRYFDYDGHSPEMNTLLAEVLKNNPCLEEVTTRITNPPKKINPRVRWVNTSNHRVELERTENMCKIG